MTTEKRAEFKYGNKGPNETATSFENWAQIHEERSGKRFIRAEGREYQDLRTAFYPAHYPDDSNPEIQAAYFEHLKSEVEKLGIRLFGESFGLFVKDLRQRTEVHRQMSQLLSQEKSIAIVSTHGNLIDPAVVAAGLVCSSENPQMPNNTSIIINKMLGWLDIVTEQDRSGNPSASRPVVGTLQSFAHVFCTVPQSKSVDRLQLNDFAESFNPRMLLPLFRTLKKGTALVCTPSGTLDLVPGRDKSETDRTVTMQRISQNTAKLITEKTAAIWPFALWHDPEYGLRHFAAEGLIHVQSSDDIHTAMRSLEAPYTDLLRQTKTLRDVRAIYA